MGKMNYMWEWMKFLTGLSIKIIETVFFDRMDGFQSLIDGNGDYVSSNIASGLLN
jgi:hypothetical protein